ncbi:MAG: HI0074 family nucleotidyltransferase substrate-binding subunit [bacterium]
MSADKISQSLRNLGGALARLREALHEPEANCLAVDGTIQRFEFVIKLYWKTLKRLLAAEGVQTLSPRETLRGAYEAKWIQNETAWLQMLKDRNETSHIYDEAIARRIYKNIQTYFSEMEQTYDFLLQRFENNLST